MSELEKEVKSLLDGNSSMESIEQQLIEKGNLKEDIDEAIQNVASSIKDEKKKQKDSSEKKFFLKEIFDRIGYGFGSEQYINILFLQTGAAYPLIALINGMKSIISAIYSSLLKDYAVEKGIDKRLLGASGIVFGFSFIFLAIAKHLDWLWLYILAILVGAVGIVSYGELYQQFLSAKLSGQRKGLIEGMYKYGLLITVVSLLLGAIIMDVIGTVVIDVSLSGKLVSFRLLGYFIIFEIAALFFIFSGYILALISRRDALEGAAQNKTAHSLRSMIDHVKPYLSKIGNDVKIIISKRELVLLLLALSLTGMVQVIGNSFYGIFVYERFEHIGFGGFINVALISLLALITSLFTPLITRESSKAYGKYPMLVFGTLLMALMPLTFFFNPNLVSIGMGTILGVMGAAIAGIASGLLSMELMPPGLKGSYYAAVSLLSVIPYIILIPALAWLIKLIGLSKLFLLLAVILIACVVPLYFVMMAFTDSKKSRPKETTPA